MIPEHLNKDIVLYWFGLWMIDSLKFWHVYDAFYPNNSAPMQFVANAIMALSDD